MLVSLIALIEPYKAQTNSMDILLTHIFLRSFLAKQSVEEVIEDAGITVSRSHPGEKERVWNLPFSNTTVPGVSQGQNA